MEQPPPPQKRLTLKIGTGSFSNGSSSIKAATPSRTTPAGSPPPQTPGGSSTKIKINLKRPSSAMPSAGSVSAVATTPVAERPKAQKKPTKTSPKKRAKPIDDDDDDVPLANGTSKGPQRKKPKITLVKQPHAPPKPTTKPTVRLRPVGRAPTRPLGEGYDSEAEDREVDPVIEEQFLLRMIDDENLPYLSDLVQKRQFNSTDLELKFLDDQGRRALLTVNHQPYAAILLDLPTITEGMKSWDKKAMVKSADICQMMLVFAKVKDEEEAKTVPLPKAVEHGHRWPHGITPPMHDARNRRFRKRLSKLEIQNKEAEVERLLALDRDAVNTKYEFFDDRQTLTAAPESGDEYEEEEEDADADADGEVDDYFGDAEGGHDQSYDDAALEAEFMDAFNEIPAEPTDLATPAVGGTDAVTPVTANTGTPVAQTDDSGAEAAGVTGAEEDEESGDDDEDDDDDGDDDMDGDGDEDRHDEVAGVKNEIAKLRKSLADYEKQLAQMTQPIMKKRIEASIRNVKSEIKLKQSSIGEADDD